VVLITTAAGATPNVMTNGFNMALQHEPPLLAMVVGPWDHSYAALRDTGECVVAVPPATLAATVVDVGNCSGADVDKFAQFELTPLPARGVGAPLVGECLANIECRVADERLVDDYNLFVLEAIHAWTLPAHVGVPRLHHRGDGTFVVDGELVDLRARMTKWPELI